MPTPVSPDSTASHSVPSRRSTWVLGLALILLAFNLRLIFPSAAVLVAEIERGTGLSHAAFGYLTTLPVLCMGLFAPLAPWCARQFGMTRTLLWALVLLAFGTALRGYAGATGLFIGTAAAGAAIAVANVLLPALVKRDFPTQVTTLTGVYVMAMYVGASLAAGLTVPIAHNEKFGWPGGISIWGLPPILVAMLWWHLARRQPRRAAAASGQGIQGLWRSALAWRVTLFMGLQSAFAYCAAGWIAPILQARGMDASEAGVMTSVVMMLTVAGSLSAPLLIRRLPDQRLLAVALMVLIGASFLGLLFAPLSSALVWTILEGFCSGSIFAVALTIIALRSENARITAQLSSMAQTAGYVIASTGPLLVGLLLDWTGGFAASAIVFMAITVIGAWAGWGAGRNRYVTVPPR